MKKEKEAYSLALWDFWPLTESSKLEREGQGEEGCVVWDVSKPDCSVMISTVSWAWSPALGTVPVKMTCPVQGTHSPTGPMQ